MNSRTSELYLGKPKSLAGQFGVADRGIILEIGEGGLAMRDVKSVAADQLPAMRDSFRLSVLRAHETSRVSICLA